jgi:hypothetical protein
VPKNKLRSFKKILSAVFIISTIPLIIVEAEICPQGIFKTTGKSRGCECQDQYKKEYSGILNTRAECKKCEQEKLDKNLVPEGSNAKSTGASSDHQMSSTGNLKIEVLNCTMSGTGGESMIWKGRLLKPTGTQGRDQFDTVLYWPHAESGLMNCATYSAQYSGLKPGTWIIETTVGTNPPATGNYIIENSQSSTMKIMVGKNSFEPDSDTYLSYADLTPTKPLSPTDLHVFRLVIYPGKRLFRNVIENSIHVKVEINGVIHYMHSSSSSRWAYTLEDQCPSLAVINPEQTGFEYNFTIDFDTQSDDGTNKHITQHYPPSQNLHLAVDHAGALYFPSKKSTIIPSEIFYEDECISTSIPNIPTWKHLERCERDKPFSSSYEYEFEIHNLSSNTQISRIEMVPYPDSTANTKFEIKAVLPAVLQCGEQYKFKVQYKPGITDGWSTRPQIGMIRTWVIYPGLKETEGPGLKIDYTLLRDN